MDDLEIEVKTHDEIASMCFAAGIETPDGTSVGAVKNALSELARLRAERDELRAAAKVVLSGFPENRDGMDYSGPLPVGIKRLRAALSRTESEEP